MVGMMKARLYNERYKKDEYYDRRVCRGLRIMRTGCYMLL